MAGTARPDPAAPVAVIATDRTWIEGDAVAQLRRVAALPGMARAVGLPDLHPGAGAPIGAAFLSSVVWPHLIGGDIGCGVAAWVLPARRPLRADRVGRLLTGLDRVRDGELDAAWTARFDAPAHDALGTIGSGNHFLEIGAVEQVWDDDAAAVAGLEPGTAVLLVHTGSRGLGRAVLDAHAGTHGAGPCPPEELAGYLERHDAAMRFAVANRAAVAARVADRLGLDLDVMRPLVDISHNSVTAVPGGGWLHRKGAAPNTGGLVPLPGSRGARSHLVRTADHPDAVAGALWSVAHGAGRKFSRSAARDRFGDVPRTELRRTRWGSAVICTDPELLAEEAPAAYKDIEVVVGALVEADLVTPVAATVPIATYKTERGGAGPEARARRRRDREVDRRRGRGRGR